MHWVLGLIGGIVGGILGYFAFSFLLGQGIYAMVLPGALVGIGCNLAARTYSIPLGVVCGTGALLLGVFLEWKFLPWAEDESLGFFLQNLHQLKPITLIFIFLGTALGFSFGKGNIGYQSSTKERS